MKHILLTGGTGLIGSILTKHLLDKGYQVSHLSRTPGKDPQVKTSLWDVDNGQIDDHSIDGVDIIIHLAGAGVADKRWTKKRKKLIIDSRTKSIRLIYELLKNKPHQVVKVISASATGYYGDKGDAILNEESGAAADFLGTCCVEWENAVDKGIDLGLNIVKFRTGVVLNKKGGALPQLALPIKLYVGSALGSGKQWIPWIHWQDVIAMYMFGVENEGLTGVYNMTAPQPATNKQVTIAVAKQLRKPLWAPKVPAFLLKLLLGEMSVVVLASTRAMAKKIEEKGFAFKYPEITSALKEIYG